MTGRDLRVIRVQVRTIDGWELVQEYVYELSETANAHRDRLKEENPGIKYRTVSYPRDNRERRFRRQLRDGTITQETYDRVFTRRIDDARQLHRIYERDKQQCALCREHVERADASREHIVSLWEGGTNKDSNVVLAHVECNLLKNEYESLRQKEKRRREEPMP